MEGSGISQASLRTSSSSTGSAPTPKRTQQAASVAQQAVPEGPSEPRKSARRDYFAEKEKKLFIQFHDSARTAAEEAVHPRLFEGVVVWVNGYTEPSETVLRKLVTAHGGIFMQHYSSKAVTHIITATFTTHQHECQRYRQGVNVVRPQWVLDCVKEGKILDCYSYSPLFESGRQNAASASILSSFILSSSATSQAAIPTAKVDATRPALVDDEQTELPEMPTTENTDDQTSKVADIPNDDPLFPWSPEYVNFSTSSAAGSSAIDPIREMRTDTNETKAVPADTEGSRPNSTASIQSKGANEERARLRNATDDDFIAGYYKASRLHHLSLWRAQFEDELNSYLMSISHSDQQQRHDVTKPKQTEKALNEHDNLNDDEEREEVEEDVNSNDLNGEKRSPPEATRLIMHIDMDCFFASVALRSNPVLAGKPLVVAHSNSMNGTSSVASASYEARKYGISNGMMIGHARELCPDLVAVPYDFEKYEQVSKEMYRIFMKYTTKIQVVSCDEALLDVSSSTIGPDDLARAIRSDIYKATGCTASVGIGPNILLARLATRHAKPNGQFHLAAAAASSFIAKMTVDGLPGVGWKLNRKLQGMGVQTCGDLLAFTAEDLTARFGKKVGETLWNFIRGIDDRPLITYKKRKSVGVDVNWGIRFTEFDQLDKFLQQLTMELANRLTKAGVKGRTVVFKLKKRRKDAPEPIKLLGHGIVDNMSRSITLPQPTDDAEVLYRESLKLFKELDIPIDQVRGIGIQVQKLDNDDTPQKRDRTLKRDRPGDKSASRFKTITLSQQWKKHQERLDTSRAATIGQQGEDKGIVIIEEQPEALMQDIDLHEDMQVDAARLDCERHEIGQDKQPSEPSHKKRRGRPPGTKNKKPPKSNKSITRRGKAKNESEGVVTLTQTLRRNNEKEMAKQQERQEAREKRKRSVEKPAPPHRPFQQQVGALGTFREWIASTRDDVTQEQVEMLIKQLEQLVEDKNLEEVFSIMVAFHRCAALSHALDEGVADAGQEKKGER